jgi:hypothetical protein
MLFLENSYSLITLFIYYIIMKLYSLKFRTELKRGRIQSFASKHGRKGEGVIEKVLSPWKDRRVTFRSQVRE